MRCSNCGKCCEETMMELSSEDIKRLEEAGCCVEEFAVVDEGVTRLRNVDKRCYFYSMIERKCQVYENRPLGCFLYPVVYLVGKGVIVDDLCPMGETVSEQELRMKGEILKKLLKNLDDESARPLSSPLG